MRTFENPKDPLEGKSGASSHVNQDDILKETLNRIYSTIVNYNTRIYTCIHALTNTNCTLELNYDNAIEKNLH